jgi:hypothetical protein
MSDMSGSGNREGGTSALLQWMQENGVAITRQTYLELTWGPSLPNPWTKDHEAALPGELRDWTRFPPDEQPGD